MALEFWLPSRGEVRLDVYDVSGRRVGRLAEGSYGAGRHRVRWDARGIPSGLYLCRLEAGGRAVTRKIVRLR
jgi:hypothetical protein